MVKKESSMEKKCDWCGEGIAYPQIYYWQIGDDNDHVEICGQCCLKGDGTVEDLTLPGKVE